MWDCCDDKKLEEQRNYDDRVIMEEWKKIEAIIANWGGKVNVFIKLHNMLMYRG